MVVVELVGQKKSLSGILIRGEMVGPIRALMLNSDTFMSTACNTHQNPRMLFH